MRADFHCHTKNVKDGESGREPTFDQFSGSVANAQIELLAITNHNLFDKTQFEVFSSIKGCCLCPGVELDIQGSSSRWHLIVFCGAEEVDEFDAATIRLFEGKNPKDATSTIDDVIGAYSSCDAFYLPHYHSKSPAIPDADLQELEEKLGENFSQLYLEPDKNSLCVLINKGVKVLIGSDVTDWGDYQSKVFTELKLPVNSFKQFKALANRDGSVIDEMMASDRSTVDVMTHPHADVDVPLRLYKEINVIFGQRGTG
jgi:hypothetical protein